MLVVFLFLAISILNVDAWTSIIQQKLNRYELSSSSRNLMNIYSRKIGHSNKYTSLRMAEVFELEDETEAEGAGIQTDEQLGKTHGYEGSFKVGDIVKVNSEIRIWHVKAYSKEGFLAAGFHGRVLGFDLYGRKFGSLCSAITPIRVEFEPAGQGIPSGNSRPILILIFIIILPIYLLITNLFYFTWCFLNSLGMFDKKFVAHFAAAELDLVSRA